MTLPSQPRTHSRASSHHSFSLRWACASFWAILSLGLAESLSHEASPSSSGEIFGLHSSHRREAVQVDGLRPNRVAQRATPRNFRLGQPIIEKRTQNLSTWASRAMSRGLEDAGFNGQGKRVLRLRRLLQQEEESSSAASDSLYRSGAQSEEGWRVRKRRRRIKRDPTKCWSKLERPLYHTAVPVKATKAFKRKLAEYLALHARCTEGVSDWTAFYMGRQTPLDPATITDDSGTPPRNCKYLLWMPPLYAGLGNRILSFISTFLYALLTDRALLVGPSEVLAQIICNPFGDLNAEWRISPKGFRTLYQNIKEWQPKPVDFAARVENGTVWDRRASYADLRYKASYEDWKFFCPTVQEGLRFAKFVGLHTDEYTVPGFYLVPLFKELMEEWFPDRRPFLHTARFLVHPANYIWQRITRSYQTYLAPSQRHVGIQVRTFYKQDGPTANRVMECAVDVSHELPPLFQNTQEWEKALAQGDEESALLLKTPSLQRKSLSVMLTSLKGFHFRYIQQAYTQRETKDGTLVVVHSEGHEGEELVGNQGQYERALQEMWLLSFSDSLLISDASSFGYVAAGISGVRPYSMNICFRPNIGMDWYTNGRPVCAIAASSEPCYLAPPHSIQCPGQLRWASPLEPQFKLQKCSNIKMGLELQPP